MILESYRKRCRGLLTRLSKCRDCVAKLEEALREARADILRLANSQWSEVEATEKQLVGYIDAALGRP